MKTEVGKIHDLRMIEIMITDSMLMSEIPGNRGGGVMMVEHLCLVYRRVNMTGAWSFFYAECQGRSYINHQRYGVKKRWRHYSSGAPPHLKAGNRQPVWLSALVIKHQPSRDT